MTFAGIRVTTRDQPFRQATVWFRIQRTSYEPPY